MYYCNQVELNNLGKRFREKQTELIYRKCMESIGVHPFSLESIKKANVNVNVDNDQNVIYFLFDDDELVYIGQSKLGKARLIKHIKEAKKTFNSFYILPVKSPAHPRMLGKSEKLYPLDIVEFMLIALYAPKYNQVINDRTKNVVNIKTLLNRRVRFPIDSFVGGPDYLKTPTVKELYNMGVIMPFATFKNEEYIYKETIREMESDIECTLMGYGKIRNIKDE